MLQLNVCMYYCKLGDCALIRGIGKIDSVANVSLHGLGLISSYRLPQHDPHVDIVFVVDVCPHLARLFLHRFLNPTGVSRMLGFQRSSYYC